MSDTWIDALAKHAADNTLGVLGSTLWVGRHSDDPSLPAASTVLTELAGDVDENFGLAGDTFIPRFSVWTRGTEEDYAVARTQAYDLFWLFQSIVERQINGFRFQRVKPQGSTPIFLGRDESDRPTFSSTFQTWQPRPTPKTYTYVAS